MRFVSEAFHRKNENSGFEGKHLAQYPVKFERIWLERTNYTLSTLPSSFHLKDDLP